MAATLSAALLAERHRRLADAIAEAGLQALALNAGASLGYLTGLDFHLMERPVVAFFIPNTAPAFVLPELEQAKLEALDFDVTAFTYSEDPEAWQKAFRKAAQHTHLDGRVVGVEPRRLRVLELRFLEDAAPHARFVSGEACLAALRALKDEAEVEHMREATRIAQAALDATLPALKAGVTEREIAAELTLQLLRNGSEGELPFAPIVAFGENSANPHASPSDRALVDGDLVLLDWGANHRGYLSDLTRVFAFGDVEEELHRIAEVVKAANEAGLAAAGPGVPAGDVDRAARAVIEAAGYGKYFVHRTGHGLGLEAHEEPYIRGDNRAPFEPGMTFTIEPGIYLPDRGGVRIEDDVVITEHGAESLSDAPRTLVQLTGL